jgi:hypothetical protein
MKIDEEGTWRSVILNAVEIRLKQHISHGVKDLRTS